MQRCLNDIFAYCSHTPDPIEVDDLCTYFSLGGRQKQAYYRFLKCSHDPSQCPNYMSHAALDSYILATRTQPTAGG